MTRTRVRVASRFSAPLGDLSAPATSTPRARARVYAAILTTHCFRRRERLPSPRNRKIEAAFFLLEAVVGWRRASPARPERPFVPSGPFFGGGDPFGTARKETHARSRQHSRLPPSIYLSVNRRRVSTSAFRITHVGRFRTRLIGDILFPPLTDRFVRSLARATSNRNTHARREPRLTRGATSPSVLYE